MNLKILEKKVNSILNENGDYEEQILDYIKSQNGDKTKLHIDDLAKQLGMSLAQFLIQAQKMENQGLLVRLPGGYYIDSETLEVINKKQEKLEQQILAKYSNKIEPFIRDLFKKKTSKYDLNQINKELEKKYPDLKKVNYLMYDILNNILEILIKSGIIRKNRNYKYVRAN